MILCGCAYMMMVLFGSCDILLIYSRLVVSVRESSPYNVKIIMLERESS